MEQNEKMPINEGDPSYVRLVAYLVEQLPAIGAFIVAMFGLWQGCINSNKSQIHDRQIMANTEQIEEHKDKLATVEQKMEVGEKK